MKHNIQVEVDDQTIINHIFSSLHESYVAHLIRNFVGQSSDPKSYSDSIINSLKNYTSKEGN